MDLSDKRKGKPVEEQVAIACDLVANPAEHTPRSRPKGGAGRACPGGMPATARIGIMPFTFRGDLLDVMRQPNRDVGIVLRRLCEVAGINQTARRSA
ncbi:hypothetical protein [Sorangium sp. So ce204]|uniref:hypothetical protein n=1 Tax=Sorangium sp. So ce204 TaxID=3133288 RepID=UPI003F61E01C